MATAAELEPWPGNDWGQTCHFLHQNLSDMEFPALANTGYFYFRKISPYCKAVPQQQMWWENHTSQFWALQCSAAPTFPGHGEAGKGPTLLHAAKDDDNKGNPKFGIVGVPQCAAAGDAHDPSHPRDAVPKPGMDSPPLKPFWDTEICASKTAKIKVHSHCCDIHIKGKNNPKEIQPQINQEAEKIIEIKHWWKPLPSSEIHQHNFAL